MSPMRPNPRGVPVVSGRVMKYRAARAIEDRQTNHGRLLLEETHTQASGRVSFSTNKRLSRESALT